MSIGVPGCCGVIEIFNSRTKFGSYQFHGNALRSMGIHYARVDSTDRSSHSSSEIGKSSAVSGADVDVLSVLKALRQTMKSLQRIASSDDHHSSYSQYNTSSCFLPEVLKDPTLKSHRMYESRLQK